MCFFFLLPCVSAVSEEEQMKVAMEMSKVEAQRPPPLLITHTPMVIDGICIHKTLLNNRGTAILLLCLSHEKVPSPLSPF